MKTPIVGLRDMLELQVALNNNTVPDWLDSKPNYLRACFHEAVEFQDYIGWKWWKHQPLNTPQAKMELVDMWHFIMSAVLVQAQGSLDEAERIIDVSRNGDDNSRVFPDADGRPTMRERTDLEIIDGFVGCLAFNHCYVFVFERLMQMVMLSWDELRARYVAKNVLNQFRQDHGYKAGTYIKDWGGKEDNEVLETIMLQRPDATPTELYASLELSYAALCDRS